MKDTIYKVYIVNIGNELLTGRTVNTNLTTLANKLLPIGYEITEAYIIPDTKEAIQETLKKVWRDNSIVIFTGGLGPTKDDITKTTLADFFQKELIYHEEIFEMIKDRFANRKMEMPEQNKIQAFIPKDFTPLLNTQGTAPGMYFHSEKRHLFSLPGVPFEMVHLFDTYVIDILKNISSDLKFYTKELNTYGIGESKTAELLENLVLEDGVNISWLPHLGRVDIRLSGQNLVGIEKTLKDIQKILGKYIWGNGYKHPIEPLHLELIKRNLTISTAESCTGGMLSSLLTKTQGASKYFMGSVVSYSNEIKINILAVSPETLIKYGAVSEETALEMLSGCKKLFNTDISCVITGIAGPDGGTEKKPVGTVYIGVDFQGKIRVEKCLFAGSREQIRQRAVEKAIFMVIEDIDN